MPPPLPKTPGGGQNLIRFRRVLGLFCQPYSYKVSPHLSEPQGAWRLHPPPESAPVREAAAQNVILTSSLFQLKGEH